MLLLWPASGFNNGSVPDGEQLFLCQGELRLTSVTTRLHIQLIHLDWSNRWQFFHVASSTVKISEILWNLRKAFNIGYLVVTCNNQVSFFFVKQHSVARSPLNTGKSELFLGGWFTYRAGILRDIGNKLQLVYWFVDAWLARTSSALSMEQYVMNQIVCCFANT